VYTSISCVQSPNIYTGGSGVWNTATVYADCW